MQRRSAPAPVATTPTVEPAPADPPADGKPAPQQESVHRKALALAEKKEREAYEANQRAEKAEAKAREYEEREARRKGLNPLELLKEERGLMYEELTKKLVVKEFVARTPEQEAQVKRDAEVEALKAQLAQMTEREQAALQEQTRTQHLSIVQEAIGLGENEYHALSSLPDEYGKIVLDAYYAAAEKAKAAGEDEPDLHDTLAKYEAAASRDLERLLDNERVTSKFLTDERLEKFLSVESNRSRVAALMATKQTPQPSPASEPKGLTARRNPPAAPLPNNSSTSVGSRSVEVVEASQGSRIERAIAAARNNQRQ